MKKRHACSLKLLAVGSIVVQPSLFSDFPTTVRRVAVAVVVLGILGVAAYRMLAVITPPPLSIATPLDQLSTSSRIVTITGTTEPGAQLTINGSAFAPDATGAFTTDVVLLPGMNTIAIEARRKHSRPARVERRINVRSSDAPVAWR
ncbi:MAG: hypothetical protein Q7S02_00210 [bacterium]|nr:hypothetical protein [bacterium]